MPDRTGGTDGSPGWVDPPELPDPRQWSPPAPQAPVPGWRERPTPPPASRTGLRRVGPWLALVAVAVVLPLPGWLAGRAVDEQGHAAPPHDAVLARYDAAEGRVGTATYKREDDPLAADRGVHDALWTEWTALVPAYWVRRVEVFEIASDGTGNGTFAAYVQPLDDRGDRWLLSVDPADAAERPEYYHETLVHELAHILTLGAGVRSDGPFATLAEGASACAGPAVRHGCIDPGSLLGRFTQQFWTAEDLAAADRIHAAGSGGFEDAAVARYRERSSAFTSPYGVTDPAEDIAETVVALAFDQRQPRGSTAAAKVDLLRQDPEVFALVDRIRATLRQR